MTTSDRCDRIAGANPPYELMHNVEVTGAARLYRAASVWTAGLGY